MSEVEEWFVSDVQVMCSDALSKVGVSHEYSNKFNTQVGVHQDSVLKLLQFIIVFQTIIEEFNTKFPWELQYTDGLAFIAETLAELEKNF